MNFLKDLQDFARLASAINAADFEREELIKTYEATTKLNPGDVITSEAAALLWNAYEPLLKHDKKVKLQRETFQEIKERMKDYFAAFPTRQVSVKYGSELYFVRMIDQEIYITNERNYVPKKKPPIGDMFR